MSPRTRGLTLGLAGLALFAPAAHAATDTVVSPTAGLASVRLSDEDVSGKLTVTVTPSAPIGSGHFSALFLDRDGDGAGDIAIVASDGSAGPAVDVLTTPDSGTACAQFGGTSATPLAGATGTVAADGASYTVSLPASAVAHGFRWTATGTAPAAEDLCGGTDGAVVGLATTFASAHSFVTGAPVVTDTTPPVAPGFLVARGGDGVAAIVWAPNKETDLAGYLVYRSVVGGPATLVGETTIPAFFDTGLANGTNYDYYVRARDTAGNLSPVSVKVTVTPQAPGSGKSPAATPPTDDHTTSATPAAPVRSYPTAVAAARVGTRTVGLTWAKAKGAVKYRVYRRLANGTWSKTPVATVTGASFVDRHVRPGTKYVYKIVGVTRHRTVTKASRTVSVRTKTTKKAAR